LLRKDCRRRQDAANQDEAAARDAPLQAPGKPADARFISWEAGPMFLMPLRQMKRPC
jgi:hypothetical protein